VSPRLAKVLRYIGVIVGLLLLVGGLALVKVLQISSLMAMGKEMMAQGPPPEAVGSAVAETQSWEKTLQAVGTVAGVQSVALSNDAPGRVTRVNFESGADVKKGQVLVELDTSVERAQLASAKSRRDLAKTTVKRSMALHQDGVIPRAQLDIDEAQLEMATTEHAALQAQIARKVVRAPFAGRLGIRAVNVGQYLNPGTTLTTLEAVGSVFVDFTLPQQRLESVKEGMTVRVTVEGTKLTIPDGTISAVDPTIGNVTRNIKLRATVPATGAGIRPGMFVDVSVVMPEQRSVVTVPLTAVVHASYGDSVFVIEEKEPGAPGMTQTPDGRKVQVARQQFVRLGEEQGDFVEVQEGLAAGASVVSAGAFKLRNGSPIVVDNSVQPEPQLSPRPENH
jgi:membrane fusion protein (multidrug efflux system)